MNFHVISEAGDRNVNEDSFAVFGGNGLCFFSVCDGLGGHGRGEVASKLVADSMRASFAAVTEEQKADMEFFIGSAITKAQEELLAAQQAERAQEEMKTTLTALVLINDMVYVAHVGDSRVYTFSKGKVIDRTIDHSVPQMLVMAGEIKEKDIRKHPDRNRLMKVLGTPWNSPAYVITPKLYDKNGAYLLCSDGFWEYIDEKMMCKYLKKTKTAEEWLEAMRAEVKKNGFGDNMDNFTAIAVRM